MRSSQHQHRPDRPETFAGFAPLNANYLYCPNQFLDLCVPTCSRGAVRIVAYVLRQTLGWLDEQGNPRQQHITISYRELIEKAGVSRGAIAPALREAITAGFLQCEQPGAAKKKGQSAYSAAYSLHWDQSGRYAACIDHFSGFHVGEGHRTPIPNAFFDRVIPNETLAVVKVVSTVLRHTIGYQTQFGGRRSTAPLAHRFIAAHAQLSEGRVVAQAIEAAIAAGYIQCVQPGIFTADRAARQPAQYTVRWLDHQLSDDNGSKKPTETLLPDDRFKKTSQNGSKKPANGRFKKASNKTTEVNNIFKQQSAVVADLQKGIAVLRTEGLDEPTARCLVETHGLQAVQQQIDWLNDRHPTENRIGMLRKAIEENWSPPRSFAVKQQRAKDRRKLADKAAAARREDEQIRQRKRLRRARKQRLLAEWGSASLEQRQKWIRQATEQETSRIVAEILRRQLPNASEPRLQILNALATDRDLPLVSSVSSD